MNLLALLDFIFDSGRGRAPLTELLRLPYHVLRACLTKMKDKKTILGVMAKWCSNDTHTVCGTLDECRQQQQNVTSVISGGYIMVIEVKPSLFVTGNVLLPSHKTPPVFSISTALSMERLQTCLNCFEFTYFTCHLIISFFYNLTMTSIYFMGEQVVDIKLISCTALPRVNPLMVSHDRSFTWRTIHTFTADTTRDHIVLLLEMLNGESYVLDPSFLALDPAGMYEKPYAIFRTDDKEISKWYKHLEFATDFCFETSMKVISKYQGVTRIMKKLDDKFNSTLCTALDQFINPPSPIDKKHAKKREKMRLKSVRRSINIEELNMKTEEQLLTENLEKVLRNDASLMLN